MNRKYRIGRCQDNHDESQKVTKTVLNFSRRTLTFCGLLLAAVSLVIACNSPSPPSVTRSGTDAKEQVLKVAIAEEISGLNPHGYDAHSFVALDLIFDPLVNYADDGTIQPGLAESWETSADSLTLTFKLRQDVKFQDGTPFNSEAAKWNFERWVNVADHDWLPISTKIAAIETPDPATLVLKLKEPYYAALQELSLVRPVRFLSPKSVNAQGKFSQPVGTGAWQLEQITPQQLSFVPNPNYWGEKPTLSKVVFDVIPDPQTRVAALLSQEVNLVGGEYLSGVPIDSIPTLKSNSQIEVLTAEGTTTYIMRVNYRRSPFNDADFRQALNYAIDRDAINQQVFKGLATPATGFFAPSVPYVSYDKADRYTYQPEQAKALLNKAGWQTANGALTKAGKPLTLTMLVNPNLFPQVKPMSEIIQAELKELGIALQLRSVDDSSMVEVLKKGDYDITLGLNYGAPYDPHSSIKDFFASSTNSTDDRYYTDPTLDQMVSQVLKTTDEGDRKTQYSKIFAYMDEQSVAIPLLFSQRIYAIDKSIKGFKLAGTEYELDLQGVTVDKLPD
jgi:nickel transport system substrate-binding protein